MEDDDWLWPPLTGSAPPKRGLISCFRRQRPSGREQDLPKPVNSFLSFYIIPQHLCRDTTAFESRIITSFLEGLELEGWGRGGIPEQLNK